MLPAFGDLSNNSVFQPYATQLTVAPKASSTLGARSARGVFQELQTIEVDGENTVYSIQGATVTGIEKTKELGANKFIESFVNDMSNNFSDLGNFTMVYSDISAGKLGKESIKMKFNKKDVETWRKNAEDLELYGLDEETAGMVIQNIIENGVTVIGDDGTFKNNFATNSKTSLFERSIDVSDEPVIVRDLDNSKNYVSFEKDVLNPKSYIIKMALNTTDPMTGEEINLQPKPQNVGYNTSGNLESHYNSALEWFDLVNQLPDIYKRDKNKYLQLLQNLYNLQ